MKLAKNSGREAEGVRGNSGERSSKEFPEERSWIPFETKYRL
jgi:hypothetical protein